MKLKGERIELRAARKPDRRKIFNWLTKSDLTIAMMGPPDFPEYPPPSWENFCDDYTLSFFNSSGDGKGRQFIILFQGEEVGTVGYDLLDRKNNRVVLDIWMKAQEYCGYGYGPDALNTLCRYIHGAFGITRFVICPSARNKRAIAAYQKAGFTLKSVMSRTQQEKEFGFSEYDDNVLMIKEIE
jgi:diamine N-acetyltransferase